LDADGDGHISASFGGDDCDDANAVVHPGAPELCDSFDNDCNGVVDDKDEDEDGYIDEDCGGDDCDDFYPNVHPYAQELCDDELDNDCDGAVDEGCAPVEIAPLVINEIDYDQVSTDTMEFIEIFNPTDSHVDLANYVVELFNGAYTPAVVYETYDLSSLPSLGPGGYLVIAAPILVAQVPASALFLPMPSLTNNIQNGPDGVRIAASDGTTVDSLSYEGAISLAESPLTVGLFPLTEGSALTIADTGDGSLSRCPNGQDSDSNFTDFSVSAITTPGALNSCP